MADSYIGETNPVVQNAQAPTVGAESTAESAAPIRIGSKVECPDGEAGRVVKVVLDPDHRKVSHIIIEHGLPGLSRMVVVPLSAVRRWDEDKVELEMSKLELTRLPEYYEVDYVEPAPEVSAGWQAFYAPGQILVPAPLPVGQVSGQTRRIVKGVPGDMVTIGRGTPVECQDGRVGTVDHILIDPRTGQVVKFVVRRGRLFAHDIAIPVELASELDTTGIYVDLPASELARLPEYRPEHSDQDITGRVRQAIERVLGAVAARQVYVRTESGRVELSGRVADEASRTAVTQAASAQAGVWEVRDYLTLSAPTGQEVYWSHAWLQSFLHTVTGLQFSRVEDTARILGYAQSKLRDLLDVAEAAAGANGRVVIEWQDLPLTRGLRDSLQRHRHYTRLLDPEPLVKFLSDSGYAPTLTEEVRRELPVIMGTLLILPAEVIRRQDPSRYSSGEFALELLKGLEAQREVPETPSPWEIERAMALLDLTV